MSILQEKSLLFNSKKKISIAAEDISSDAGLLLIADFLKVFNVGNVFERAFRPDDKRILKHKNFENLLQLVLQIIAGYRRDDDADELRNDPVFKEIIGTNSLASQPTISRFISGMTEKDFMQLKEIMKVFRIYAYSIKCPETIILDLDSTLLATYGKQEGEAFNFHYQKNGYHPLVCYDGKTGELIDIKLREGTDYSCTGVDEFITPIMADYFGRYPDTTLLLRGDSGFATPKLYKACESNATSYAIRLKRNKVLSKLAEDMREDLYDLMRKDAVSYQVAYGEFMYKAASWEYPRRVVCKLEKPSGVCTINETFVVTNMDLSPQAVIEFYCDRGQMENYIKESKNGFFFDSVSSSSMLANACRLMIHAIAYNLFIYFKRLVLPGQYKKMTISTIRLKLFKVGAKVVHSSRYTYFKLSASCAYKDIIYQTLKNIMILDTA